jgi:hypothetical protein
MAWRQVWRVRGVSSCPRMTVLFAENSRAEHPDQFPCPSSPRGTLNAACISVASSTNGRHCSGHDDHHWNRHAEERSPNTANSWSVPSPPPQPLRSGRRDSVRAATRSKYSASAAEANGTTSWPTSSSVGRIATTRGRISCHSRPCRTSHTDTSSNDGATMSCRRRTPTPRAWTSPCAGRGSVRTRSQSASSACWRLNSRALRFPTVPPD